MDTRKLVLRIAQEAFSNHYSGIYISHKDDFKKAIHYKYYNSPLKLVKVISPYCKVFINGNGPRFCCTKKFPIIEIPKLEDHLNINNFMSYFCHEIGHVYKHDTRCYLMNKNIEFPYAYHEEEIIAISTEITLLKELGFYNNFLRQHGRSWLHYEKGEKKKRFFSLVKEGINNGFEILKLLEELK